MKQINLKDLTKLDNITKILLIILVVAVSYFVMLLILKPFFVRQPASMSDMMDQLRGGIRTDNLLSFIVALIIGVIVSFYLFSVKERDREYDIIKKVLSEDEKKVLSEIKKAGEITQDSLRFRLNWSKAKISTILTNLDKKGIVQRQRTGKTYNIYLQNAK